MVENKKTLTVTLQVKELIFDVQNKAYLTGQSREAEGSKTYQAASNMQASDDQEDSYQIRRSITNAYASLKSLLGEYLVDYTHLCPANDGCTCITGSSSATDNLIYAEVDSDDTLKMTFELPSNFSHSSSDSLGNGIHTYIVDMALGEWFTITNREEAASYITHATAILEVVKKALYKRSRPSRPTYV